MRPTRNRRRNRREEHDGDLRQHDRTDDSAGRSRRTLLGAVAGLGTLGLAGCSGLGGTSDGENRSNGTGAEPSFEAGSPPSLPTVENPPGVVYVPSHREGVEALEPVTAGPYRLRPMVSYAHPFWIVSGSAIEPVDIAGNVDVHLMVAVEDRETGTTLPVSGGLSTTIRAADGDLVDQRSPWRMLSQTMGFHFGDNVPLGADGEYEVTVELPPLPARTTGRLDGRFDEARIATFSFTYDQPLRDALIDRIRYTDDADRGVPGAIEPMNAAGSLPDAAALPGTRQGVPPTDDRELPRSDDVDVAITIVEDFLVDDEPYLLVSPRTPYNRFPLVGTAIEATVRRGGDEVTTAPLRATVDDQAGYHYGASVPELSAGDDLRLDFGAVPGVARHQGYETAFIEMEPVESTVEDW